MNEIIQYLRDFINDNGKRQSFVFIYEGVDTIPLPVEVKEIISITANGNPINYTLDNNIITINDSLNNGDIIQIELKYYKYSNEELKGFIRQALYYLTIYGYGTYTIESGDEITPELATNEKYLVADIASILILENYTEKRLPNGMVVRYPKNKSKRQIIEDLIYNFMGNPDYYSVLYIGDDSETV